MGGKVKVPHSKQVEKKMRKEVVKGERSDEIETKGIAKKELEREKKLLSKMPIKEKQKPLEYFPVKKKHPISKHHKISKRSTPGKVIEGQGPDFDFKRGKKADTRAESKILTKTAKFSHKLNKKH